MIVTRAKLRSSEDPSDQAFWLSYSDLMAGLLMVFIVLLVAALVQFRSGILSEVKDVRDARGELVAELERRLSHLRERRVVVDSSGTISFGGDALFDQGSAVLRGQARALVVEVADTLSGLLMDRRYSDLIGYVVIEGHTNAVGLRPGESEQATYAYNLDLSQKRALAVMQTWLETSPAQIGQTLQQLVSANGRSFVDFVRREPGPGEEPCARHPEESLRTFAGRCEDGTLSRRIEIQFRWRDAELLSRIEERMGPTW